MLDRLLRFVLKRTMRMLDRLDDAIVSDVWEDDS